MWYVARLQLGVAFTLTPAANTIVKTGLYSLFSHPIYLFSALSLAGFCLLTRKMVLLGMLVIMVPIQIYRARIESEVMTDRFGTAYSDHLKDTWV